MSAIHRNVLHNWHSGRCVTGSLVWAVKDGGGAVWLRGTALLISHDLSQTACATRSPVFRSAQLEQGHSSCSRSDLLEHSRAYANCIHTSTHSLQRLMQSILLVFF